MPSVVTLLSIVFVSQLEDVLNDVTSADDANDIVVVHDGHSAKVVIYEAVADVHEAVFFVESFYICCHELIDAACMVLKIEQQFDNVFFGKHTDQLHVVVEYEQAGDVGSDEDADRVIDRSVVVNGDHVGGHNIFSFEHL